MHGSFHLRNIQMNRPTKLAFERWLDWPSKIIFAKLEVFLKLVTQKH